MVNFIQYRLPDDDNGKWILNKITEMGLDEFTSLEQKVHDALDKLKPGKYYDLNDLPEDKLDAFIKLSCLYILHHPNVSFSNDYSRIEKMRII